MANPATPNLAPDFGANTLAPAKNPPAAPDKDQLQDALQKAVGPGNAPVQAAPTLRIRQPRNSVPPSAQQVGIHGSIGDFNHKLQTVHDAFTSVHGTPPPTGLVLDIIRSPVPEARYQDLFELPGVQDATRLVSQHLAASPHDFYRVTPDGQVASIVDIGTISRNLLSSSQEGPQFYGAAYQRNKQFAKPGPYQTKLSSGQEQQFRQWVAANNVPFDPNAKTVDYDMRGFWLATKGKGWQPGQHFPDTWKTPYDTSFSNQSKYATPDNPYEWNGNNLVDRRDGSVVFGPGGPVEPGATVGLAATSRQLAASGQSSADEFGNQPTTVTSKTGFGTTIQSPAAPPTVFQVQRHYGFMAAGFVPGDPMQVLKAISGPDTNPNSPIYQALKGGATFDQVKRIVDNHTAQIGHIPISPRDKAYAGYWQMQAEFDSVKTVKQAQHVYNQVWGTSLPETGWWNGTWAKAYVDNQKSATILYSEATYLAQQQGFATPDELERAWSNKIAAAKASGLTEWVANALPMQVFSSGSGFLDILKGLVEYPFQQGTANPVTFALHVLTRSAGETMHVIGGSVDQLKADAAAGFALVNGVTPKWLGGYGETYAASIKDAAKIIHENPSWVRAIFPHASDALVNSAGGQLANILGDIILLRKPAFTGETVLAGDEAAALASPHVAATTHWAFNDLKAGNVANAASLWGNGRGAEQLAVAAEKAVQEGRLSEDQLRQLVANVHLGREVTVDGKTVSGPILSELAHKQLITPGKPGRLWLEVKDNVRNVLDQFDQRLRNGNRTSTSHAADLISTMRSAVYHASPRGSRGLYDIGTPEALYNYVLKNFKDPELAASFEDKFVRLRAYDNTVGLTGLNDELKALYDERFPVRKVGEAQEPQAAPFEPILSTEAPIGFHFPTGGKQNVDVGQDAWDRIAIRWQNRVKTVDGFLNKLAVRHAALIVASGLGTFWKHNIADTAKRFGLQGFHALGDVLSTDERAVLERAMADDPAMRRAYGMALERNRQMEARYLLWKTGSQPNYIDFATGEHFADKARMAAAGGYVRRRADDDLLNAYRASTLTDMTPLAKAILGNRYYRGRFGAEMGAEIRALKGEAAAPQLTLQDESARITAGAKADDATLAAQRRSGYYNQLLELAKDYSPKIAHEFSQFEQAALTAGVQDPWAEVARVIRENPGGKADKAIGEWIAAHNIEFDVRSGVVSQQGRFDKTTTWALNKIMVANKWNRGELFKREFELKFADLTREGVKPSIAASIATDVADRLVKYHMFDFSNRLGIEQDLRYLSYFATKHRLNWKWVLGQMIRKPGMAAAISDVQKNLNQQGGFDFTLFGMPLSIPVARLFWVPGKEYDEVSPIVQAVAAGVGGLATSGSVSGALTAATNSAAGTYGNIFTRDDQTINLAVRYLVALADGHGTYGLATAGLPASLKKDVWHRMDVFQQHYMATHHGRPAPEAEVVKYALSHATANQFWLSFLPLPVLPQKTGQSVFDDPTLREYMTIIDPRKKTAFLNAHPELEATFGVYKDPSQYVVNQQAFGKINAAKDKLTATEMALLAKARMSGWTREIDKAWHAATTAYSNAYDATAKEFPAWAKSVQADPLLKSQSNLAKVFPNIDKQNLATHAPGQDLAQLRAQLTFVFSVLDHPTAPQNAAYNNPADLAQLKTERNWLLGKIDHWKQYPTNPATKTYGAYQQRVSDYYTWSNNEYLRIQHIHLTAQRELAQAGYALEREQHNQPVVIDGVKFPGVAQARFWHMDGPQRDKQLSLWASDSWGNLAGYEKQLLGINASYDVTEGWYFFNAIVAQIHEKGQSVNKAQKQWLAQQIDQGKSGFKPHQGFYRDYTFALQPRIIRYEATKAYQDMTPKAKAEYERVISGPAKKLLAEGAPVSATRTAWNQYITQLLPWIQKNAPELNHYVQDVWPAHLIATLVSR